MTGYDLSRQWFDWCSNNPEKIKTNHHALYFFCIEHNNRLGWKDKFGLPTDKAMETLGIKNYKTYRKTLDELIEFGFVNMIEYSRNQWSSNIIALVKNTKAITKATTIHIPKQLPKQLPSTVSIDKPIKLLNKEHTPEENNLFEKFTGWVEKYTPRVNQLKEPLTIEQYFEIKNDFSAAVVTEVLRSMQNKADLLKRYVSANLTIRQWCRKQHPANDTLTVIKNFSSAPPLKQVNQCS